MNIQHVLSRINEGDYDFFLKMTDEEVKEVSPYVLMLWLRGATKNREVRTLLTDVYVNQYLFSLNRHPKLLYMLMCHANEGLGDTRFVFKNDQKSGGTKEIKLVMRELGCNESAARLYLDFLDEDDIKELSKKYEEVDK